jgi:hypothetical protein
VQAERWSATQDCATRREPRKTLTDYFIAAGCGAAGLDQRLNLAINAGLADPRLKARLDEIGLFDERDVRRGGQDSSLAGACLRQSGSAQPTTRFSICLGVGLNRRRLRPPEAVQRLRSGGGKGPHHQRPPIELGGRPHGAGAGLGTTARSGTCWRGPAARAANPRRSKASSYRSRLSVRRGAGRPTVAGHFTTAVRLAPRRLPIRAVGRWAMSREKEPAPGGRATNEIVEEIVDNLRPWKGGQSVAAITAAVNDQLVPRHSDYDSLDVTG